MVYKTTALPVELQWRSGGRRGDRTLNLRLAGPLLSQVELPAHMERDLGLGPSSSGWKPDTLPVMLIPLRTNPSGLVLK